MNLNDLYEMRDPRDAYERDIANSTSGFGKDSQAYRADGGANDENHALDQQSSTWYIRLNDKLIRDKQGNPYSFQSKAAANKAALTMQAKLFNKDKEFMLTTNPNDKSQGVAEGWVKGEYGRVLDALQLYYPRLGMTELNVPGYHKVIADKANVPVEYAAQVINDFARDDDPDEDEFSDFNDDEQGVAETQQLSVQQLATVSDAALDKAYGYGRSQPGNSFGWQANLKSAAFAKQMIDKGVTDIEAISDAIHKGWNTTAQAFVQNPEQFDDTAKLKAAGKLEAKLQQRAQLMKQNYGQLPEEEKEKDRVVARALLQALKGEQGVAEGKRNKNRKLNEARLMEDPVYRKFKRVGRYIAERRMSEKEILQVFADAEAGMTDKGTGANRTMLGRGKDTTMDFAGGVADALKGVWSGIQKSVPVEAVDYAYDEATNALADLVGGQKGAVMQAIKKYRMLAKQYPKTAGLAKAALVGIAGLATGGAGLPAVAALVYGLDSSIKGDKLSDIALKAGGAAATAWAAGKIFGGSGDPTVPADNFAAATDPVGGGTYTVMQGDQGGFIAQANGVPFKDLQAMNPDITDWTKLPVGTELQLPPSGPNTGSVWQGTDAGASGSPPTTNPTVGKTTFPDGTPIERTPYGNSSQEYMNQFGGSQPNQGGQPGSPDAANFAGATTPSGPSLSFPDGSNSGTLTLPDGREVQVTAFPEGGIQPRLGPGSEAVQVNYAGQDVTAYIRGDNAYIKNFNPQAFSNPVQESWLPAVRLLKLPANQLIDKKTTILNWKLNESTGRKSKTVNLTTVGAYTVFENIDRYRKAIIEKAGVPGSTRPEYYRPDMMDAPTKPDKKTGLIGRGLNALDRGVKKVGSALGTFGRQFTTNVTKEKLKMNWQQAGKPSDSDQLATWLTKQGVPQEVVTSVFNKMSIPYTVPAPASTPRAISSTQPVLTGGPTAGLPPAPLSSPYGKGDPEQTKVTVAKLSNEKLQSFISKGDPANPHVQVAKAELAKRQAGGAAGSTGTTPSFNAANIMKQPGNPNAAAGAFSSMAGQLAKTPTTSSTGGTTSVDLTKGITTNRASANNPNRQAATGTATPANTATTASTAGKFPGEDPTGSNYVGRLEVKRRQAARAAAAGNSAAKSTAPQATSTTAGAPSKVTYSGLLAPKKSAAPVADFSKTGFSGYQTAKAKQPAKQPSIAEGSLTEDLQADDGEYYSNSAKFFGQFEADHFDNEETSPDGMEIRGYIDGANVMAWRFKSAKKVGGWGIYDDSALEQDMAEGWKEKVAAATLAGTMALGAAGAGATGLPGGSSSVDQSAGKPVATQVAPTDAGFINRVQAQHRAMEQMNPQYAKDHAGLNIAMVRGIGGGSDVKNQQWAQKTAQLLQKYGAQVKEDIATQDSGEYDYEGDQAKDQMNTIVRAARRLDGLLDDNENMPEWVQMKVTLAADYLDTAADYIESNQEPELEEGEKVGNMDADKFDAAMARLKQLAGAGPLKTVYDPTKRVYRNVPVAVQPKK